MPPPINMTRPVTYVEAHDSLAQVHRLMDELNIRHLPVVEDGRLIGLISDRDLLRCAAHGRDAQVFPAMARAADVMTTVVATCRSSTTIADVAQRMLDLKVNALPITSADGKLVGIVTSTDILRHVAQRDRQLLAVVPTDQFMNRYCWDIDLPESII